MKKERRINPNTQNLDDKIESEALVWETFGVMLNSGIPILQSLNILRGVTPSYVQLIQGMHDGIKEGDGIVESIKKYAPNVKIHPSALQYLDVGEETGALPNMCIKLSELINLTTESKEQKTSKKSTKKIGFYTCLNDIMDAGLPLLSALQIMNTTSNYLPQKAYNQIENDVENGLSFSDAISKHPKYFRSIEISMLQIGEETGTMQETCSKLSNLLIKEATLDTQPYSKKEKGKIQFYLQLSELVDMGMPLLRCLREIEKNAVYPSKKVIKGLSDAIESGNTFSETFSYYPKVFTSFETNMIKAGEAGGVLEVILKRTADYLSRAAEIKYK